MPLLVSMGPTWKWAPSYFALWMPELSEKEHLFIYPFPYSETWSWVGDVVFKVPSLKLETAHPPTHMELPYSFQCHIPLCVYSIIYSTGNPSVDILCYCKLYGSEYPCTFVHLIDICKLIHILSVQSPIVSILSSALCEFHPTSHQQFHQHLGLSNFSIFDNLADKKKIVPKFV